MRDQIAKYTAKLIADRAVQPDRIAFAAKDDVLMSAGDRTLAALAEEVLGRLNCLALVAASPSLLFADYLVARAPHTDRIIVPRDTETRTFLHDIPFIRATELSENLSNRIAELLGSRKGVIVEGIGIIATGALTVEQAFINWSSVFHSTFVKYLEDLLETGFLLPGEFDEFRQFRSGWLRPLSLDGLIFREGPLDDQADILDEMAKVGRYTVTSGLVDSFFGNISCRLGEMIYISQTASSLDELAGCIDPVPFATSSTTGITASSELAAHKRIYETCDALTILHGHPKFAVVLSMRCEERGCDVSDCWRDCAKVRIMGGTPVVAGEIGAGGLAKRVPPVIGGPGRALVYGHGVFTIGRSGFGDAFSALVEVENWCRLEYFRLFDELFPIAD